MLPCRQWLLEQDKFDRGEFGKPVDEAELAKLRTAWAVGTGGTAGTAGTAGTWIFAAWLG